MGIEATGPRGGIVGPLGGPRPAATPRVAIITLRSIGDVVLSTPAIRAVRQHLPAAHLTVLVLSGSAEILSRNPDVDEWLVASNEALTTGPIIARAAAHLRLITRLREQRFDLLIDLTDSDRTAILSWLSRARRRVGLNTGGRLRGLGYHTALKPARPPQHLVDYSLQAVRALGVSVQADELVLPVGPDDMEHAARLLAQRGVPNGSFAVMHPAAWWRCPGWSLEQYGQLADRIQHDLGVVIIMVGTAADRAILERIQRVMSTPLRSVAGQTTLLQLAALTQQARVFIGGNSGPMHIAAAVKTPVIAVFGPEAELGILSPWGKGHTVFCGGASGPTIQTEEVYAAVRHALACGPEPRP